MTKDVFAVKIICPHMSIHHTQAAHVLLPGLSGEWGIGAGHGPFVSLLKNGVLKLSEIAALESSFAYYVSSGFFRISTSGDLFVMVDVINRREEINIERLNASEKRAKDRLEASAKQVGIDINRALLSLERAKARKQLLHLKKNIEAA